MGRKILIVGLGLLSFIQVAATFGGEQESSTHYYRTGWGEGDSTKKDSLSASRSSVVEALKLDTTLLIKPEDLNLDYRIYSRALPVKYYLPDSLKKDTAKLEL